ncbi:MAG: hypothetical protein WA842_09185 [Croceibacterium sp.]
MTEEAPRRAAWTERFLAVLAETRVVTTAARAAGISPASAYYHKQRRPDFAAAWNQAQAPIRPADDSGMADDIPPSGVAGWRSRFLEALVETSNVSASAIRAAIPLRTVYKARRNDPAFAAKWRAALAEGYENLEMELLAYLRDPQGRAKMDVANAIRLMAMHREEVARERAVEDDRSEAEVLESINRMIDDMRLRSAANSALLAEEETADELEGE